MILLLLLLSSSSGLKTASSLLKELGKKASGAVYQSNYRDPRLGTWIDNPVGGAAERDGSWLEHPVRKEIMDLMVQCGLRDGDVLLQGYRDSALCQVFAAERYQVRIVALTPRAQPFVDTEPCGSVSLTAVLDGRVEVMPMVRLRRDAAWTERASSKKVLFADSTITTALGGPPRQYRSLSKLGVFLQVILRPPLDETIRLDGPPCVTRLFKFDMKTADKALLLANTNEDPKTSVQKNTDNTNKASRPLPSIGGLDEVLAELRRRVLTSRRLSPEQVKSLGLNHVRGVLLYGPPGCGKTLLARYLASILQVDDDCLTIVNGPELLDKFVGVAERKVRELFDVPRREWKQYRLTGGPPPPLRLVVLDEIDALCRERGSLDDSTGVRDSVTAQLLSCFDGVEDAGNVLIVGTSNRPELLDPALLRPGRLEVKLFVPPPQTPEERRRVVAVHALPLMHRLNPAAKLFVTDPESPLFAHLDAEDSNLSAAEFAGILRAGVASALDRALEEHQDEATNDLENQLLITYEDLRSAFDAALEDKRKLAALGNKNHRKAAWPQLAQLESLWIHHHDRTTLPATPDEAHKFLEYLAYDIRTIRLPLDSNRVADLSNHFFRYLNRH